MLNYKTAKSIFLYKPNGTLVWKVKPARNIKIGVIAGTSPYQGYVQVSYNHCRYYAHRIIWLLNHGKFPKGTIDHINGNKADNRIQNLRDCTNRENCSNQKIHRDGKQVGYTKVGIKYQAAIKINGKQVHLGTFKTEKEAVNKYQEALRKHKSL